MGAGGGKRMSVYRRLNRKVQTNNNVLSYVDNKRMQKMNESCTSIDSSSALPA